MSSFIHLIKVKASKCCESLNAYQSIKIITFASSVVLTVYRGYLVETKWYNWYKFVDVYYQL